MGRNLDSIVLQALHAVSLARWNRLRELEDLLQHYPRHLARGLFPASQELLTSSDWAPLVDISETPEACLIKAGLAGIRREQIKVKLAHGVLTLRGERPMGKPGKDPKHPVWSASMAALRGHSPCPRMPMQSTARQRSVKGC